MSAIILPFRHRLTSIEKRLNFHIAEKLDAERRARAERSAWFHATHYGDTPGGAA